MTNPVPQPQANKPNLPSTLLERFALPLFFVAIGYAAGFWHGNTSGKRKSGAA